MSEGGPVSELDGQDDDGFKTSTFSGGGSCVAVRNETDGRVTVRHSKDRARELTFTTGEWAAFVRGVKAGEFDPM